MAHQLFEQTLRKTAVGFKDIAYTVATGYGRDALDFANTTITEITCHSEGVCFLKPEAKTIIDIGGQDSKLIRMDSSGHLRDFVMNERCAAGTGRFLEIVPKITPTVGAYTILRNGQSITSFSRRACPPCQ